MSSINKILTLTFLVLIFNSCKNKWVNEKIEFYLFSEDNTGEICTYETKKIVFYKKCHQDFYSLGILKDNLSNEKKNPFYLYDFYRENSLDSVTSILDDFNLKFKSAEIASISKTKTKYIFKIYYKSRSKKISFNIQTNKWGKILNW